jgi:uncharacterized protein with PhoU and TrkA domain
MNDLELQHIELTEQEAKATIELSKALDRLSNNRDFKKVVLEGYFKDEAVRLVLTKANPACSDESIQKAIVRDIDAIGSFRQYLGQIQHNAEMAKKALLDCEGHREYLQQQGE